MIVSNRVPSARERGPQAGGLVVALRDSAVERGGLWFGWSGAVSDRGMAAPSLSGAGALRMAVVDLSREECEGYYNGFANATLWPLLHYRLGLVEFDRGQFETYGRVNRALAESLIPLLREDDLIWVHDYHLVPFGGALRARGVRNRIGFFLHIPFPPSAVLEALPEHELLAHGLGAYDVVGVQTEQDLRHLREYLERALGARQNADGTLRVLGRDVRLGAFDVGIDTEGFERMAETSETSAEAVRLAHSLSGRRLIIGVDRLDYSKGLPHRFAAYDGFLRAFPEHRGLVSFLQIAPVSRGEVHQYRSLRRELEQLAGRINSRYAEFDWQPLRYLNRPMSRRVLAGFYRLARVGLVTPLRDGMNLVAKEFVAAQRAEDPGVLVLSRFAGAAERMDAALLVNPLDIDAVARTINRALTMPLEERARRHTQLMTTLRERTARRWVDTFLEALGETVAA